MPIAIFQESPQPYSTVRDLFEFVVWVFADLAEDLVARGLLRGYALTSQDLTAIKGRIHLAQTLSRHPILRDRHWCGFSVFTPDIGENRILRLTIHRLSHCRFKDARLDGAFRRLTGEFTRTSLDLEAGRLFAQLTFDRLNEAYRPILSLAEMLLDNLTVTGSRGGHQFFGFLIDMNLLFERYVCAALADAAVDWGGELLQQDSRVLDENQTTKVIPDAIFCRDSMPALVIDAKYKLDPGRGDLHQMIAYCHALNLSQAVLVYPDHEDAPAGKLSIRGPGSISVYYLALGLKGGPEQPRWQREELKRNLDPIVAEATRTSSCTS